MRDLVLIGAGHAHVEVLRRFGLEPPSDVRLTLVTRERQATYSGMLPGVIEGVYAAEDAQIDAARLSAFAGARFIEDEVTGLDLAARRVLLRAGAPISFDLLSINSGARPATAGVPGAAEHAIAVKPLGAFLPAFAALRERVRDRGGGRIVLVGGGAGGVELMLALERRFRRKLGAAAPLALTLIAGRDGALPGFPAAFREKLTSVMGSRGIDIVAANATAVAPGEVALEDGRAIPADELLWVTNAAPPAWLEHAGLALDDAGFVRVDANLSAIGHPRIFAAGDSASFAPRPLPKSGVYAVRAGPVLAHNLRAAAAGARLRPFRPQRQALYILGTGEGSAVGTRNGITLSGGLVWRFKRWLDERFIARYRALTSG